MQINVIIHVYDYKFFYIESLGKNYQNFPFCKKIFKKTFFSKKVTINMFNFLKNKFFENGAIGFQSSHFYQPHEVNGNNYEFMPYSNHKL